MDTHISTTTKRNITRMFTGLFLLTSSLSALALGNENVIWNAGYDYVAIVPSDTTSNNTHPVELGSKKVYELLESIHISERENGLFDLGFFGSDDEDDNSNFDNELDVAHNAIFNTSELRKISPAISRALSLADTNQDVVFSVSGRVQGTFGKSVLTTTGRIFHTNNQLNIIFGEVYVDIKKKYRRLGKTSDVSAKIEVNDLKRFRLKVGSRSKQSKLPIQLLSDNSHKLKVDNNTNRDDWLMIDLVSFNESITKQQSAQKRKESIVEETDELQTQTQSISQEQQQLKEKVDRLERQMQTRNAPVPTTSTFRSVPSNKSLEQRLTDLKTLHDKGVISEGAYNDKVKSLLNEL